MFGIREVLRIQSPSAKRLRLVVTLTAVISALGCMDTGTIRVGGEYSDTGECPEESCFDDGRAPSPTVSEGGQSTETTTVARGLTFVGTGFWDDSRPRLGPIVVGGTFDLGLDRDGEPMPGYRLEFENPGILRGTQMTGVFTSAGYEVPDVDAFVRIEALRSGTTYVRIVSSRTGQLIDRVQLQVDQVAEVEVLPVGDPDRAYLVEGVSELIGVRMFTDGGLRRIIDESLKLRVVGEDVQPENMYWDCFSYAPPIGAEEVTFEASVGGVLTQVTYEVRAR